MNIRIGCIIVCVAVAAAALFTLSGCFGDPFEIQLVNEGAYPIAEVLVYPVPDKGEAPGPAARINRMPQNARGASLPLAPHEEVLLPWTFRQDTYVIAVTFYDINDHVFRQAFAPGSYDLTFVKGGYPVVLRAAMNTDNTPVIEIEFVTRF